MSGSFQGAERLQKFYVLLDLKPSTLESQQNVSASLTLGQCSNPTKNFIFKTLRRGEPRWVECNWKDGKETDFGPWTGNGLNDKSPQFRFLPHLPSGTLESLRYARNAFSPSKLYKSRHAADGSGARRIREMQEFQKGEEGSWGRPRAGPGTCQRGPGKAASRAGRRRSEGAGGARELAALGLTHLPIHRAPVRPQARDSNPRPEGTWRASTRGAGSGRPRCPRPPSTGSRRQGERSPWLSARPHYHREWGKKLMNESWKRRPTWQ